MQSKRRAKYQSLCSCKERKKIMNRLSLKTALIFTIFQVVCNATTITANASSAQWPIVTRSSKMVLPPDLLQQAKDQKVSILRPLPADLPLLYHNYPAGATLFPANSDLASKFDIMINAIKNDPTVIEFFRKIQINVLNQIYNYFVKIYLNFNLTNPGCNQTTTEPTAEIGAFLNDEATYATTKKKLIMNHFINLIQAQFGASIISYVPTTPPDMAVAFGTMFIANDQGLDLKAFVQPQTDPKIITDQTSHLQFLQKYIDFYKTYTSYLAQTDATGVNQYYTIANTITQLPTLSLMKPGMFFYDLESMRSIMFIPFVASTLPQNSQLIPWAPSIVNAATKNLSQNGHAIAYFKDASGNKTANPQQAHSLFLLTETGTSLFEEELLVQPAWMNNKDGCVRILQGCLGNFVALVGTGIIDATLEKIIQKATNGIATPPSATPTVAVKKK